MDVGSSNGRSCEGAMTGRRLVCRTGFGEVLPGLTGLSRWHGRGSDWTLGWVRAKDLDHVVGRDGERSDEGLSRERTS